MTRLNRGRGQFVNFFKVIQSFLMQEVYFLRLMRVSVGLRGLSHEMDLAFDDMHGQF